MRSEVPDPSVTPNNLPMLRAQPRLLVCSPVRQINYIGRDFLIPGLICHRNLSALTTEN